MSPVFRLRRWRVLLGVFLAMMVAVGCGLVSGCTVPESGYSDNSVGLSKNHKIGRYKSHGLQGVDWRVAKTVFDTAKSMGVKPSDKVMIALFEAALVESGCNNLDHGDRDSLGVFQQRRNWGTRAKVRNVPYATQSFLNVAIPLARKFPKASPGLLAQSVQRSSFGGRYALREADARAMIKKLK